MFLTALDLIGVFVFALSGGVVAVEKRLDPFGVVFLAFVAAASGGIARDVLIGATPPYALQTWTYAAVATAAGMVCYFGYGYIRRLAAPVAAFDALGLGLFAVVGARKALDAGLSPLMAAMLGMITAIGGGMARDILTAQTPMVLQRDIYALAALLGAGLAGGDYLGLPDALAAPAGAALATGLRLLALSRRWTLPLAPLDRDDA
ncbi:MAG: trimeric intracellular cation channel family protein [Rhodoblastus sp.]|nr:MAG: trimeric intracellular cation channel family protein [Rhodoblastus sp.]